MKVSRKEREKGGMKQRSRGIGQEQLKEPRIERGIGKEEQLKELKREKGEWKELRRKEQK